MAVPHSFRSALAAGLAFLFLFADAYIASERKFTSKTQVYTYALRGQVRDDKAMSGAIRAGSCAEGKGGAGVV